VYKLLFCTFICSIADNSIISTALLEVSVMQRNFFTLRVGNLLRTRQQTLYKAITSRSRSYCLSLSLCLQWYKRLITLRVHLIKRTLTLSTVGDRGIIVLNHCLKCISSFSTRISHSRQWSSIHLIQFLDYHEEFSRKSVDGSTVVSSSEYTTVPLSFTLGELTLA